MKFYLVKTSQLEFNTHNPSSFFFTLTYLKNMHFLYPLLIVPL